MFKSKYYLKDILPNNYVDSHNHLLPGIDDGSKTIEETALLIAGMKQLNINSAIATPHTFKGKWDNTTETIKNAFEIIGEDDENKSFLKGYASEYMLDASLMERVRNEPLLCIHENYILLEFNLFNKPINLYDMLFEIKVRGYKIIIAHPERYLYFHDSLKKHEKLKEYGVYFQLNLLTLVGHYGKDIKKIAEQLLEKELYDFTGTDIHNEGHIQKLLTKPIRLSNKNKMADLLQKNNLFILDKVLE
jgi:tyrosine-protein phosphatase YwqE